MDWVDDELPDVGNLLEIFASLAQNPECRKLLNDCQAREAEESLDATSKCRSHSPAMDHPAAFRYLSLRRRQILRCNEERSRPKSN